MRGNYSSSLRRALDFYLGFRFKFAFDDIHFELAETQVIPDLPMLITSNHVSWWDGFFISEVQRRLLPGIPHYTIMLDSELRKYPFFSRIGAIGIDPAQPTKVAQTFLSLRKIRRSKHSMSVALFPQGQITPQLVRPIEFKRGVETLIRTLNPVQIIPVALHIEPLSKPRPTALIRSGRAIRSDNQRISTEFLEAQVQMLLDQTAISDPLKRLRIKRESEVHT